jgi:uncharacterized C2H2 Zn-finger protein
MLKRKMVFDSPRKSGVRLCAEIEVFESDDRKKRFIKEIAEIEELEILATIQAREIGEMKKNAKKSKLEIIAESEFKDIEKDANCSLDQEILLRLKSRIEDLNHQIGWCDEEVSFVREKGGSESIEKIYVKCPGCGEIISMSRLLWNGQVYHRSTRYQTHLQEKHSLKLLLESPNQPNIILNPNRKTSLRDINRVKHEIRGYHEMCGWHHDVDQMTLKDVTQDGSKLALIAVTCPECGQVCKDRQESSSGYKAHLKRHLAQTITRKN